MHLIRVGAGLVVLALVWFFSQQPGVPAISLTAAPVADGRQGGPDAAAENTLETDDITVATGQAPGTVPLPEVTTIIKPPAGMAAVPALLPEAVMMADIATGSKATAIAGGEQVPRLSASRRAAGAEPLGLVSMMLSDPERLQALNPVDVAACEACLAQLADALVYGSLTETVFTALLDWLAQADDPRLASLLWSVLTALEQQSGYDVRVDRVLAAMGNMASVPAILVVVRQWLDWSSLRLSGMAGDTFAAGVHETLSGLLLQLQDQQTVGRQLLVLYRELEPGQARHLLQIGPPGLLLQVGYQHLERGDTVVFNGLLQQLPDMSSIDMPGVLLGFERRLQAYGMDDAALREAALAWVAHQAGDEEVFNLLDDWVAHGRLAWPERQLLEAMLAVAGQP